MLIMILPVFCVKFSQFLVVDHQKILSIVLFGSLRDIGRPCDHGLPVNDHDLVMGYGVLSIYYIQMLWYGRFQ